MSAQYEHKICINRNINNKFYSNNKFVFIITNPENIYYNEFALNRDLKN